MQIKTGVARILSKGYKQTEIGVIPVDWEVHRLKKVVNLINGRAYKQEELLLNGKYQVLRVGNFFSNNSWYYSDLELEESKYVVDGDLMYAWSASFGPRFWNEEKTIYHYHIWKVVPSEKIDKLFLFHLFEFDKAKILNQSQGGTMFHITKGDMENRFLQLPTITEQTLIATALSDADALISSLEKLIAKKRNIKQGAMQKLLQPKEGWEVKKLGEIATFFKGKGLPKSHLKENGRFKCIHYGELFTKYKESIKSILSYTDENENCFYSSSNDVLMPTSDVTPNGLATASCIKEDGVILGGDVLVIRLPKDVLDGLFLSYNISQNKEKVMSMVTGSTVYHLYGSDMKRFEIYYPPIEQQIETIKILFDMDNEITALETKLEKYKKVKLGMMQELLTGKIRLV